MRDPNFANRFTTANIDSFTRISKESFCAPQAAYCNYGCSNHRFNLANVRCAVVDTL
ncbi:hypothetical protein CASFOL_003768 [Castilleja foliolosa]|uniref:Uncharacterized protein n=1 Tax=Castilleja foliolosa TaxID=1961234 RepID=A0ABD3EIN8_9LAMI